MQSVATLSMDENITNQLLSYVRYNYCKMKTSLVCKYESKLECYGMKEWRQEKEVLHKALRNLLENLQHNK